MAVITGFNGSFADRKGRKHGTASAQLQHHRPGREKKSGDLRGEKDFSFSTGRPIIAVQADTHDQKILVAGIERVKRFSSAAGKGEAYGRVHA
jgi:hypothetical protein